MMVNKTVNHNARKMVTAEVVVTNFSYMFTCVESLLSGEIITIM